MEQSVRVSVDHNNIDKALRRLRRKLQREGVMRTVMDRQHFMKPSDQRRKEAAAGRRRWERKLKRLQDF